jgi:succinate-semialdehyde dehydrogenase/glutarate-semialdehyde dehydrogenase
LLLDELVVLASFTEHRVTAVKEDVGTGATIEPWGYQLAMIDHDLGPFLVTNYPDVIKSPAEVTLSALTLAYLADEESNSAGLIYAAQWENNDRSAVTHLMWYRLTELS